MSVNAVTPLVDRDVDTLGNKRLPLIHTCETHFRMHDPIMAGCGVDGTCRGFCGAPMPPGDRVVTDGREALRRRDCIVCDALWDAA